MQAREAVTIRQYIKRRFRDMLLVVVGAFALLQSVGLYRALATSFRGRPMDLRGRRGTVALLAGPVLVFRQVDSISLSAVFGSAEGRSGRCRHGQREDQQVPALPRKL